MTKKTTVLFSMITAIAIASSSLIQAQTSPLTMPDISIIGRMSTRLFNQPEASEHVFKIDEIELSFQGNLYQNVRASIFVGVEHETDEFNFGIEEAYITWTTPGDIDRLSVIAGKKRLGFGKVNPQHPEQWKMPNPPAVIVTIFGEEGLAAEGVSLAYILPTPWFTQLEIGSQKAKSLSESAVAGPLTNARVWTAWELTPDTDIEIGLNGLLAHGPRYKFEADNCKIYGVDITAKIQASPTTSWLSQSEWISLNRSDKNTVNGGYTYLGYQWSNYWDSGIRWDYVTSLTPDTPCTETLSAVISNRLTETTKYSLQYTYDTQTTDSQIRIAFTFGLGPHSHNL